MFIIITEFMVYSETPTENENANRGLMFIIITSLGTTIIIKTLILYNNNKSIFIEVLTHSKVSNLFIH